MAVLSLLPSLIFLGLAALYAITLALKQTSPPERVQERSAASHALLLAVLIQAVHFTEEALTGFHEQFPALFNLPSMPFGFFLTFNLVWLGIWLFALTRMRTAHRFAYFAAWFLALAGMLNGIAHPLFAIRVGGYFPGLLTAPFIGAAGVWLWMTLQSSTRLVTPQQA